MYAFDSTVCGRFEFGCNRLPRFDARPVTLRSQVNSRLECSLGTPARAKARTEHSGVNSDCIVDVDPHNDHGLLWDSTAGI